MLSTYVFLFGEFVIEKKTNRKRYIKKIGYLQPAWCDHFLERVQTKIKAVNVGK